MEEKLGSKRRIEKSKENNSTIDKRRKRTRSNGCGQGSDRGRSKIFQLW